MPQAKAIMAVVLLLCLSLVTTLLPLGAAVDAPTVLIHEGAEQSTFEEWDVRWERYDANGASSQDWWCRTMHESKEGVRSIYCARNGYNSHYLSSIGAQPWNINITGLQSKEVMPDQSNLVMRYDTDQDSIMRKVLVGASSYNSIEVTFWFYSDTGVSNAKQPLTKASVGYDFLNLVYYTGFGNDRTMHVAWTDSYQEATAARWIQKAVNIPNYATMVGFEFVSGSKAPQGGDLSDAFSSTGVRVVDGGMKEGVFLDDIIVTGTGAAPNVPLVTSVDNLAQVHNSSSVPVSFTINQPTVPFGYVLLFYRAEGGDWTRYTTADNPDGRFRTSPIDFNAGEDGRYEFYTQGFDVNGGMEPLRGSADAFTVVDTQAPVTGIKCNGTASGQGSFSGPVSFVLEATDNGTGVSSTFYKIDDGAWAVYSGGGISVSGEGQHQVSYYSVDGAGNEEVVKCENVTIISAFTELFTSTWAVIGGTIAVITVVGVVMYRRSRK